MGYIVASDHAGVRVKTLVVEHLRACGIEVEDLGTSAKKPVDYPDMALAVAHRVARGDAASGILVCGTGIGMSMAANKVPGIRAAVCRSCYEAKMSRAHNDANVLCLGERVTGLGLIEEILSVWLDTEFEGGRHERRVEKIRALDGERRA